MYTPIMSKNYQKTLNDQITFKGIGLHNGKPVKLIVKPAQINHGIKFCRVDVDKDNLIDANYLNVVEPVLHKKIRNKQGTTVSTVEHLMAAFFGEGVDNALVEINSSEVPILDGSANEFVEEIRKVGVKKQERTKKIYKSFK